MNRIITINLGGRAIQIEEDAYDSLRNYLQQLEQQFAGTENGKEIIDDIESRISDILAEKLKQGRVSINKSDIDDVVRLMGKPSDFGENEENKSYESSDINTPKRLFRDADNRVIGGVCSGLANYLNLDVTVVRIIWLILFFIFGTGFLIYIILWAVVPKATTTAEKLQMKGEAPNIENIKKSVADEARKAMDSVNKAARSETVRNAAQTGFDIFGKIIRGVLIFAAIIISAVLLVGIVGVGGFVLFGWENIEINNFNYTTGLIEGLFSSSATFWLVKVAIFCFAVLPMIAIAIRLTDFIFNRKRLVPPIVYQAMGVLWLVSLVGVVSIAIYTAGEFKREQSSYNEIQLNVNSDTLIIESLPLAAEMNLSPLKANLNFENTPDKSMTLGIKKSARGRSEMAAADHIRNIEPSYLVEGNTIKLSPYINLKNNPFRNQEIDYTIKVPEGTVIKFGTNTSELTKKTFRNTDVFSSELPGHTFIMNNGMLTCKDCSNSSWKSNYTQNTFNIIEIEGAIPVKIRQDGETKITINGSNDFKNSIMYNIESGVLTLAVKDNMLTGGVLRSQNEVVITMPDLKKIKSDGANVVEIKGFKTSLLEADIAGVSKLTLDKFEAEIIKLELDGGSLVKASGKCDRFDIDIAGTGKIEAFELTSREVNVNADGAGNCEVNATEVINGELNGVVKVKYRGNPKLNTRNNGAVKVEKAD